MALTWLEHKGRKILFADFRAMTEEQMVAQLHQELALLKQQTSKVLVLADVTSAPTGTLFMGVAKELGPEMAPFREREAILGIDGLKSMLLRVFNRVSGGSMQPFDNAALAKDYLVG